MPTTPYGWTVFCDDIREETGGKFSYMGVYGGALFINKPFPVTLPKFALSVHYRIAFDDDRLDDIHLAVFLPGDEESKPSITAIIQVPKLIDSDVQGETPGETFREFNANFVLAPLTLKEKGKIRVRAEGGAGIIKLGALNIDHRPELAR
jgi:hypothetical protein